MKVLLVGADSAVGKKLLQLLKERGIGFVAPGPQEIDATDPISAARVITHNQPDQVINLSSYAAGSQLAPYSAEADPEACALVNESQAGVLAQVCDHLTVPLIHLSTALVFSGGKKLAYSEDDKASPAGIYGKTALAGELAIHEAMDNFIIVRSGWLFGPGQDQVLRAWLEEVRSTDGTVTAGRRKLSPTPTDDLARVLLAISLQVDCGADVWGTYHYSSLESRRESEFAQDVIRVAARYDESIYRLLDHLSINNVRTGAPDIANTTLASKKIFETFGIKQRAWHGSLEALIKSYYGPAT